MLDSQNTCRTRQRDKDAVGWLAKVAAQKREARKRDPEHYRAIEAKYRATHREARRKLSSEYNSRKKAEKAAAKAAPIALPSPPPPLHLIRLYLRSRRRLHTGLLLHAGPGQEDPGIRRRHLLPPRRRRFLHAGFHCQLTWWRGSVWYAVHGTLR